MQKSKKFLLLALVPAFVLVLSGCGKQPAPQAPSVTPTATQEEASQPSLAPENDTPAATQDQLPPLPTDNTQAIDTEIQGIDQELTDIDNNLTSDTTDSSLGL